MGTRIRAAAGALAAMAALGSCGAEQSKVCNLIAADSGVTVELHPEPGMSYRLCAGAVCDARRSSDGVFEPYWLAAALPDPVGEKEVDVRFTITPDGAVRPAVDERVRVALRKDQPNGPGCAPTVYRADFDYRPGEGLARVG